jgi:predicted GNAT family N-acyltransferase
MAQCGDAPGSPVIPNKKRDEPASHLREMNETSAIEEIEHGSAEYRAVLVLRDQILRRPLGLVLTDDDTAGEHDQRHFVLRKNGSLLAGVIAMNIEPGTVRLRQMWVREDMAGQGLGRSLLAGVEQILGAEDFLRITLNARIIVRGFYEKCGYTVEGPEFEEIGIPHVRMTRRIPDN